MKKLLCICILFSFFANVSAQKESFNWFFGENAALEFSSGVAYNILGSAMNAPYGCSSISDSIGNLLFYTDGKKIYNRLNVQMPNGNNLLGGSGTQNCIIIPYPSHSNKYFVFTVGIEQSSPPYTLTGLYYSIVNMALDAGKGDIDPFYKNIELPFSDSSTYKITAVRHQNGVDVWVIVRNLNNPFNQYHSYLITSNGVNTIPKKSICLNHINPSSSGGNRGQMKVSPDGKFIFSALYTGSGNEIGSFNTITGLIENFFLFRPNFTNTEIHGVDYSPDSKYLYLTTNFNGIYNRLLQYDLSLLPDKDQFLASMKIIAEPAGNARDLQAGPDGKIYVALKQKYYLGVINNPSGEGVACDYDTLGVYLGGNRSMNGLPQFIQTYFLRFQYEGKCAGESFSFTPNFNPVPDSIHWDFGDPASGANNTSTELNPQHVYSQGGEYTVTVFVRYPDGRTENATRQVTVTALPEPYTGNDTLFCKGASVNLQAQSGYTSYLWSTNQTTDFITVADTGYYWVEAVNEQGCIGRDTLHAGWFPVPQLAPDTVISPTTCGNLIGAITGVNITGGSPPYNVTWLNSQGDTLGTTPNLYNLGVDNYYLWVTDQNGCTNLLASFAIQNFDSDLIITGVNPSPTWCNQPLGILDVQVQSGLSDRLLYSLDNWTTYQTSGIFTNLPPDSYYVKVRDSLGCEAVYINNPVTIQSQQGVEVTGVAIDDETDLNGDGKITVSATGDTLSYTINGSAPQSGGLFDGLSKGTYTITVIDIHGCDSTFTVEVDRVTGQTLFATAGDTAVCNGLRASEPLMVSNFKDITSFEITLAYNNSLLDAAGYINTHPDIVSGLEPINYPSTGTLSLKWTGTNPLTLADNTVLLDVVMQGKNPGLSSVDWVLATYQTRFINKYGVSVPVIPEMGSVRVAPSPEIWGFYQDKVCEYSPLSQMAIPSGGTGPLYSVIWETPKGNINGSLYEIPSAGLNDAGLYRVKVIDQMNCMATDSVEVSVIPNPITNFPDNPIPFENQYTLEAPQGYASYEWSNGETNYFITVTEEGEYSVIIKTTEGCESRDTAMLVNVAVPVYVPNAFTPNGDGLNDTFKPIILKPDLISQYHLSIYNRWGQCFFETSDPSKGWDGKDELPGVYNWVVSYMDGMGKVNQIRGVVTLIK